MIELYDFQKGSVGDHKAVALYWDMGLGKTYGGLDRAKQFNDPHILIVCQKSKVQDWIDAVMDFFGEEAMNLRVQKDFDKYKTGLYHCAVINYDLLWRRREELYKLTNYTLVLDESSLIKNPKAQRTKATMRLKFNHLVLLSGTPCSGKYEELITQCHLLGWKIDPNTYIDFYCNYINIYIPGKWTPVRKFIGYKNVKHLKKRLTEHGADFKLSTEYLKLPQQNYYWNKVEAPRDYKTFERTLVLEKEDGDIITGDTPLVKLLRLRQLCNGRTKREALEDMVESTNDRLVIFYNFDEEKEVIKEICKGRPLSYINGKEGVDLENYKNYTDSVTLCQYQAGAYGHNLQLANKMIFYSPPLSCEQYEQAQKRIHRIGQQLPCFYWRMCTKGTIEEKIYQTLKMRQDYTMKLFTEDYLKNERKT